MLRTQVASCVSFTYMPHKVLGGHVDVLYRLDHDDSGFSGGDFCPPEPYGIREPVDTSSSLDCEVYDSLLTLPIFLLFLRIVQTYHLKTVIKK